VLASVHIADIGARAALTLIAKGPSRITAPGLLHANLGLAAPLGGGLRPKPDFGRVALIAMWDDDQAVDHFLADAPIARLLAGGWHARLQPLRAFGSWPGLADDLPRSRAVADVGPVAVLTLGRARWPRLVPFLRASAKAEARAVTAPGLIWATGIGRPPFFATCSLWQSGDASAAYAFEPGDHNAAIAAGRAKPFHHQEAFVRFRAYDSAGHLDGRNPLTEAAAAAI
jgi:hypothetical protein